MWPRPDPYAIPSKDEIQEIEADILHLEAELVEARRRVAALESDIFARKAWIAPIRRLPHETLSLILLEVSINHWKAPLKLQSVCRLWRNILLDTPAAWSFIDVHKDKKVPDSGLVSIFLERSGNVSMHIYIHVESASFILMQVISSKKRITCLQIGIWAIDALMSEHNAFGELEMLFLFCEKSDEVDESKGHQFDMMRLSPKLRCLGLERDQVIRMITLSPSLPAIQDLYITSCGDSSSLIHLLKRFAGSVKKMTLFCPPNRSWYEEEEEIAFPMLQLLRICDETPAHASRSRLFKGSTPALQGYVYIAEPSNYNRHSVIASFDPENIRYLQVVKIPDLSFYPRLHSLIVLSLKDVDEIAKQLRQEPTTCPGLTFIMCCLDEGGEEDVRWEQAKAMLREHAEIMGRPIKLLGRKAGNDPEFRKHFMNSEIYPSMKDDFFTFTRLPAHNCRVC